MKPGDFMLGVLDFFAVLLPGSLATWLVTQYIPGEALRKALSFGLSDGASLPDRLVLGAAFLLSAYTLGHFVFMAGSGLDASYDRWRERVKPKARDKTYQAARKLQEKLNADLIGGDLSTLKWAKVYIQHISPAARLEIDRLEADQKFFRSLIVVAVAFAAHFLLRERVPAAGIAAFALAALAHQRYREQRWKMTELIFATAVIVHQGSASGTPARTIRQPEGRDSGAAAAE